MASVLFQGVMLLLFLALLGAYCAYLKTARDTLRAVSPQARRIRPGKVWLMLIPFFNIGYSFIFTKRLALSISADLIARSGGAGRQKFTYDVGLAMSIVQLVLLLSSAKWWMPFVQLGWVVLWIAHWVQVAAAARRLRTLPVLSTQEGKVFADL